MQVHVPPTPPDDDLVSAGAPGEGRDGAEHRAEWGTDGTTSVEIEDVGVGVVRGMQEEGVIPKASGDGQWNPPPGGVGDRSFVGYLGPRGR
jgi:hypothetical protein